MNESSAGSRIFEGIDLGRGDPRWSSWSLQRLIHSTLDRGVGARDVYEELDRRLGEDHVPLTHAVANFLRDLNLVLLERDPGLFDHHGWTPASTAMSPARAYLAILAVPPETLRPTVVVEILKALASTTHFQDALDSLSGQFDRPEIRRELDAWLANGISGEIANRIAISL